MAYIKQNWVDGTTKINAERMNHIEDGIESAARTPLAVWFYPNRTCDEHFDTIKQAIDDANQLVEFWFEWEAGSETVCFSLPNVVFYYNADNGELESIRASYCQIQLSDHGTIDDKTTINCSISTGDVVDVDFYIE